jgi:glucokinase
MKTKFQKAMHDEIEINNDFEAINMAIQQAKEIKIVDLVDMNGKTMGEVAEVIALLKNCNQLEIIGFEGYEA